ncbi:MAG: hypothetical protein HND52_02745 [Ignavibacteriae bacterium]|nr:hypothetical protein [Ignavibacteriota bacterium]NOG96869.1 hypothetical protein [Ignavibacteriota bacterium]
MNAKKSFEITEELRDKIISAAYGDAGFIDKIKINKLAAKYPEVKILFDEYSTTANAAHSIKLEECPDELLNSVGSKIGVKRENKKSFLFDLYTALFTRPIVSAAAASILVIAIVTSIIFNKNEYQYNYSPEEIALADKQVKESLYFVSKIFNKAQTNLTDEILTDRVAKPISKGINLVNDLFIEGDKNENFN